MPAVLEVRGKVQYSIERTLSVTLYGMPTKMVSFGVRETVGVKSAEVLLHILHKVKKEPQNH